VRAKCDHQQYWAVRGDALQAAHLCAGEKSLGARSLFVARADLLSKACLPSFNDSS
jgi:hypothetical protein